jgi:hypothetical protein
MFGPTLSGQPGDHLEDLQPDDVAATVDGATLFGCITREDSNRSPGNLRVFLADGVTVIGHVVTDQGFVPLSSSPT